MIGAERPSSIKLRLLEWWWEPSAKIVTGFVLVVIIAVGLYAFGPTRKHWDFWSSRGLGAGWECTSAGRGGICRLSGCTPGTSEAKIKLEPHHFSPSLDLW